MAGCGQQQRWAVSLDVDLCSAGSALLAQAGSHARTQRVAFLRQRLATVEPQRSLGPQGGAVL